MNNNNNNPFEIQLGEAEPMTDKLRHIMNSQMLYFNKKRRLPEDHGMIPEDKIGKKRLFYVVKEFKNSKLINQDMKTVWEDELDSLEGLEYTGKTVPSDSVPIFNKYV